MYPIINIIFIFFSETVRYLIYFMVLIWKDQMAPSVTPDIGPQNHWDSNPTLSVKSDFNFQIWHHPANPPLSFKSAPSLELIRPICQTPRARNPTPSVKPTPFQPPSVEPDPLSWVQPVTQTQPLPQTHPVHYRDLYITNSNLMPQTWPPHANTVLSKQAQSHPMKTFHRCFMHVQFY